MEKIGKNTGKTDHWSPVKRVCHWPRVRLPEVGWFFSVFLRISAFFSRKSTGDQREVSKYPRYYNKGWPSPHFWELQAIIRAFKDDERLQRPVDYSKSMYSFSWMPVSADKVRAFRLHRDQMMTMWDFNGHRLVRIGNTYYDPSYGEIYETILDFENNAIAGFVHERRVTEAAVARAFNIERVDLNGNGVFNETDLIRLFVFRQNPAGLDLIA